MDSSAKRSESEEDNTPRNLAFGVVGSDIGRSRKLFVNLATETKYPKIHRHKLYAIVGFIVLLPISFLGYQAWFNTKIAFLVPSFKGQWILHRSDELFPGKISGTVLFRRHFKLTAIPRQTSIAVRAASQYRMLVNGRLVEPDSRKSLGNWKFARNYDLAPFLLNSENTIEIRVTNDQGLPALLVQAFPWENNLDISSDTTWESALVPDISKWRKCVYPYQEPPVLGEDRSPIQRTGTYPVYWVMLGAYSIFIIVAIKPWSFFSASPDAAMPPDKSVLNNHRAVVRGRFRISSGMLAFPIILAVILALYIHNVASYPYRQSPFDGAMHLDYIKYVASTWRVPVATQGWEMYHPPLYYFVSAIVYKVMGGAQGEPASIRAVQVLGMLSGLACLLLSWLILRICSRSNKSVQVLGWCIAAFLPMLLYMAPTISNEIFSAGVISLSMYLLMRYGFQESISIRQATILGLMFGLAMLSKYTAFLFFLIAVGIFLLRLWIRPDRLKREMAILLIFVTVACSVCGWFYVRNIILFHNPFVTNGDEQSGFHFEQPQGYRTLGFYFRFGAALTRAPERSRWFSFWDGYYGSMWMDTHFNMINYRDHKASSYGTIILCLALLPSAAICLGWIASLRRIFVHRLFEPHLALVVAVPLTMLALVQETLRIPYITALKAFYTISLLPAFAVFSGIGLYEMAKNLGKFSPLLYTSLFLLFALTSYLFWYRPF
jgi:4-amino-4-deoxy-L-arabinose transferase-like glycosyltransferase